MLRKEGGGAGISVISNTFFSIDVLPYVPDHSALAEEVVVVSAKADGRALGASEPRDHQHDKHQHLDNQIIS